MSFFDDVTSYFTSPDPSSQPSAPSPSAFQPGTMLSSRYSLASMTVTNQNLSQANLPSTQNQMNNLIILADVMEQLTNEVGPFTILSAFRTGELQNALAAQGEPTASGTSFHEVGRGIDIAPSSMSITEFFGRLLSNDDLKSKFSEIAIKPTQNSIHLAVNVPGDVRDPKVLGLNADGVYAKLTLDDIVAYIAPFMPDEQTAIDYADAKLVTRDNTPLILAIVVGFGAAAYLLFTKGRKA